MGSPFRHVPFAFACTQLSLLASAAYGDDLVKLRDGSSRTGEVMELGGNSIDLVVKGGATRIPKRDIDSVIFDEKRTLTHEEASDGIVRQGGHIVRGKVELIDGGAKVQVTLPQGKATYDRKDVVRILRGGETTEHGATVYTAELGKSVSESITKLGSAQEKEAADAETFLASCGILAISRVRSALKDAKAGSPSHAALVRLDRLYHLKEVVGTPIEESEPRVYDVLTKGSGEEKKNLLLFVFPRFVDESVPLAQALANDPGEDATVRAWSVDFLQRMQKNRELLQIYRRSTGQVQLAAAIALAQNRVLVGVPALIEALEFDSVEIRRLAFQHLKESTGQDFQYRPEGAPQARKEAVERWRAWWQKNEEAFTRMAQGVLRRSAGIDDGAEAFDPLRSAAVKLWKDASFAIDSKKLSDAEALLRRAIEMDPGFAQGYISLAVILYSDLGRAPEAAQLLQKIAHKRMPDMKAEDRQWILLHLGHALTLSGSLREAASAYSECRKIAPENLAGLKGLAEVSYKLATSKDGFGPAVRKDLVHDTIDAAKAALTVLDKMSEDLVLLRAENLGSVGELPFDRREYNRSVLELRKRYRGDRRELSLLLAKAQSLSGDPREGMVTLKGLIDDLAAETGEESKTLQVGARTYLGLLYEQAGQPLFALREYQKVVKDLDPGNEEALRGMARVKKVAAAGESRAPKAAKSAN